jgi:hypothetical protein
MTGAEWYATIYAFAESPRARGVLWAGSDDGRVHVSRNSGESWENVTPPGYGTFTRTAHIDPSPHDPAVVYVAANRYQQDDFQPYLWKSADYGKTWTAITSGIPATAYTRVVREDPVRRGLLYAGTEYGVWVSFDDGAKWEPLQLNLPRVSVRDLKVHQNDLIAATHGRAFWVIDDLSPLRQLADSVTRKAVHLFQPSTAVLWWGGGGRGAGENPPSGVSVDYWFREVPAAKVTLDFLDQSGTVLRSFSSGAAERKDSSAVPVTTDSIAKATTAGAKDSLAYYPSDSVVQTRQGTNRFVWNLRLVNANRIKNTVIDEGHLGGPAVLPGNYSVRLVVGADTMRRTFSVIADPRVTSTPAELAAQFDIAKRVVARINEIGENVARVEDLQAQLDARVSQTKDQPYASRVADMAKGVRAKLEAIRAELYEIGCHVDQCTLDMPVKLYNWFITLNAQVQQGAYAPTKQHEEIYTDLKGKLDAQLRGLEAIENGDLASFNRLMQELGVPSVFVAPRKPVS